MEKIYSLALSQVKGIGINSFKNIIAHCNSAENAFKTPVSKLIKIPGIGYETAHNIKAYCDWNFIKSKIEKADQYETEIISIFDKFYPKLLKQIPDAPSFLFTKGQLPKEGLNISIVGTRNATNYGKEVIEEICSQLPKKTCIISGLAIGIDTLAHKSALKYNLKTIGVLGSSTDMIYPKSNLRLSKEIIDCDGAILSEYLPETKAEVHHFPMRNRIVAGLSQITIVVESKSKGGSLITAKLANEYDREVYAIPGAIHTQNSQGCNELIAAHGASIFTSVEQMLESIHVYVEKQQSKPELNLDLNPDEKLIFNNLCDSNSATIDGLSRSCLLPINKIASLLLTLEFRGIVDALPGNKFKLKEKYKICGGELY